MSDIALRVEGIGKKYRIGRNKSGELRETFSNFIQYFKASANNQQANSNSDFWALNNISFNIKQGEAVGIIGRNGAGKSTLLKVLARITKPTIGRFEINGRVSSLLEVGTGFHPELTGRENIFLNGTILGMRSAEIKTKFDEILAFSGVEEFIDTPVKHYSSGMKVRLAFSVAAHLEPEILIIDEVLAVGDAEFQKKCLGKMGEVAGAGRTVLFVSHNMEAVSSLTNRSILLNKGECVLHANTDEVINRYLNDSSINELTYLCNDQTDKPRISKMEVITSHQNNVHQIFQPIKINVDLHIPKPLKGACFSFQVCDYNNRNFVHMWTFDVDRPMCREIGKYSLSCSIPIFKLYKGNYKINAFFTGPPGGEIYDTVDGICPFEIKMLNEKRQFEWQNNACAYLEEGDWSIEKHEI